MVMCSIVALVHYSVVIVLVMVVGIMGAKMGMVVVTPC